MENRKILILLIIWRIASVWIVQTYHVPDEYWQSLEVAHKLSFGYGYLTWEWRYQIRSYIYPFVISILYKLLGFIHLDSVELLTNLPRIFQGILSGYGDYRFYKWTESKTSLFLLVINWYWYYCASRTIINTVETSLTMIALSIFPWNQQVKNHTLYLWIVGFVCAIRPTMAIIWTPLCFYHLMIHRRSSFQLLKQFSIIALSTLAYSIAIDSFCYGEIVVTSWNFFRINVINSIASHYGKEHILWYLTSGLPVLLGLPMIYLPFAVFKIIKHCKFNSREFICLFTIVWTIGIYSLLQHKEFRFLLPLLPLFIFILTSRKTLMYSHLSETLKKIVTILLIATNLIPGLYISIIHQRGPLDLMKLLHQEVSYRSNPSGTEVLFLMPCHSTPFYSHLHRNITMRFLTCEPNLNDQQNYLDEADQFFENPSSWLQQNFSYNNSSDSNNNNLPNFIATFDSIESKMLSFLKQYNPIAKIFHANIPQSNCGQNIILYKYNNLN